MVVLLTPVVLPTTVIYHFGVLLGWRLDSGHDLLLQALHAIIVFEHLLIVLVEVHLLFEFLCRGRLAVV